MSVLSVIRRPPSCDLELLSSNLKTLTDAFQTHNFLLVTEPKSIALFKQESLRGRFWTLFNASIYASRGNSESRKKTFCFIQGQLHCAIEIMNMQDEQFRSAVESETSSYTKQQDAIYKFCRKFPLFSPDSTTSITSRLYPIEEMFKIYGFVHTPLISPEQRCILERTSIDYAMTAVLSRVARPFPMSAFKSILESVRPVLRARSEQKEILSPEQKESLKAWIQSIQRSMAYVCPGVLHKALQGCVSIILKDCDPYSKDVQDKVSQLGWCIANLPDMPLTLLLDDDRAHLQWILATTCQKVAFETDQVKAKVSRQVVYASLEKERFSLYENDAACDTYILMANNRFRLGMWDAVCKYQSWAVEPLQRKFRDPQGKFFVIEKVAYNLADYIYKSQDAIDPDDVLLVNELARLLEFWASHTKMPAKIDLDSLFVKILDDKSLVIKAIIPIEWQTAVLHDYSLLEQFAWIFAKGNIVVFTYLMNKSGLCRHRVASALYSIYQRKLTHADVICLDIEKELPMHDITDKQLVERAKGVIKELERAQNEVYVRLLPHRQIMSLDEVEKKKNQIANLIVAFHEKACFCTMVHPKLFENETYSALVDAIIQAK